MPQAQGFILEKSKEPFFGPSDETPQRTSNPSGLRLRLAKFSDLPHLVKIEMESFDSDRFSPRTLHRLATRPTSCMLVAEMDGAVVGYAAVLFRAGVRHARLYGLCVAKVARGRGIGSHLLEEAEIRAEKHGKTGMTLEVRCDNPAACILYANAGYIEVCQLPSYYADGCNGFRLIKRLNRFTPSISGKSHP